VLVLGVAAGVALGGGVFASWWLRAHGLTAGEYWSELRQKDARYEWTSVDRKHWQAAVKGGSGGESPDVTDAREGNNAGCPKAGMVRVKGAFRTELHGEATGEIERMQDLACTDWISREFPARCREYDRERIAVEVAKLPTRTMDYCIDRFEYPNVLGQNPIIVVGFAEAGAMCKGAGKRLCTEHEWTFACEGEEVRPYPYGYSRDTSACVMDRSWRPFAEGALSPRDGDKAKEELDRLWQGEPSGSRGGCRSPFGVYDMAGNVDEWTQSARTTGYPSILKCGYWGPVRARCRPATRAHGPTFVAYQQGFRCCSDADPSVPAPTPAPVFASHDAGAEPVSIRNVDAGPAKESADLALEWDHSEEDEIDAITKARVRLGCASGGGSPGSGAAFGLVAAIAVLAKRRRATR
jgi:MYXO-CTERM domain-containing protein